MDPFAAPAGSVPRTYDCTGASLFKMSPSFVNVGSDPFLTYMKPSSGFIHTRKESNL